ncbi:hypothetical protein BD289DRAFT_242987 [Coniella lustricola]|uniref:Uncharacterized protein n=1 Tax=Coniella lustricola TaxID=2025994 RepID=A0A2T3A9G5_9PEZI|nr:hypothetical protein BD289DRAFT_242987 [Coniella lustricola]
MVALKRLLTKVCYAFPMPWSARSCGVFCRSSVVALSIESTVANFCGLTWASLLEYFPWQVLMRLTHELCLLSLSNYHNHHQYHNEILTFNSSALTINQSTPSSKNTKHLTQQSSSPLSSFHVHVSGVLLNNSPLPPTPLQQPPPPKKQKNPPGKQKGPSEILETIVVPR